MGIWVFGERDRPELVFYSTAAGLSEISLLSGRRI
jgi:hypothetical protein